MSSTSVRSPAARPTATFHGTLVEECVALALGASPGAPYWRDREAVYLIDDPEERERAFLDLGAGEFERLGLGAPLERALAEQPLIGERIPACRVLRARARREEGAELYVAARDGPAGGEASRVLALRVLPSTVVDGESFLSFLRHELYHIADMVDPDFGYDPALPRVEGGPLLVDLVVRRYRVLWDTVIDGRLARAGRAPVPTRELRRREFARTFPMLGGRRDEAFAAVFDERVPTHARLLAWARESEAILREAGGDGQSSGTSGLCPTCRCPWPGEGADTAPPDVDVVEAVGRDFPAWRPADGICPQCAELFRARARFA